MLMDFRIILRTNTYEWGLEVVAIACFLCTIRFIAMYNCIILKLISQHCENSIKSV